MKILQIIIAFIPSSFGGIKNHLYYQAKEMVKKGHSVTILTSNAYNVTENNDRLGLYDVDGIKVRYFSRPFLRRTFIVPSIVPYIRDHINDFDIVHLQDFRTFLNLVTYYYAKKNNIPYVISAGGSVPWGRYPLKIIKKLFFDTLAGSKMLANASNLIALSNIEVEQYENVGIIKDNITIVPNGIDPEELKSTHPIGYFRKKNNIGESFLISFVGRIHEIKGLDFLVESFKLLLEKLPTAKLVIAGDDHGYLDELSAIIDKLNILENIIFTGFISGDDKWALYLDSDVFVITSKKEAFGNVVPEAAYNKTPIVLSDGCAIASIVKENGFGEVVPYGNHNVMSDVLYKILSNEVLRKDMAKKGQEFVLKNWTWEKSTNILLDVYLRSVTRFVS